MSLSQRESAPLTPREESFGHQIEIPLLIAPASSQIGLDMVQSPALVVLAAGMGSRYGGLKQMDPMGPNGETVLDYSVFDAIRAGFSKVIFVIREDFANDFKEKVGSRFQGEIELAYVYQSLTDIPEEYSLPEGRTKPWGTAHAVRAARHDLDRPFAVINADDFYGADAYIQAAEFLSTETEQGDQQYALVGYQLARTLSEHGSVNRGICQTHDHFLQSVEEIFDISRKDDSEIEGRTQNGQPCLLTDDVIVSMNLWAFPLAFIKELEDQFTDFLENFGQQQSSECYIPSIVDDLIKKNRIRCHVLETTASWFGVTYPKDKPYVVQNIQKLVEAGSYPSPLR